MDTINDIATTTAYNGKTLLDGTYDPKKEYIETPTTGQQLVRAFMSSLDETSLSGTAALDEAIAACTAGKITSTDSLISNFMSDLNSASSYTDFLQNKCGIILGNEDTGAITGSDAGGDTVKTAESIVPEQIAVTSWGVPTSSTTTINGLTVKWPTVGANGTSLTAAEKHILAGLNSDWIEQCTNLVAESFGLNFEEDGTSVREISVKFEDDSTNNRLAAVGHSYNPSTGKATELTLIVNMYYYSDIDTTNENGALLTSSSMYYSAGYLDRTIAHEFTHAVMAANIDNFNELPLYLKEGMAELVHGIDDERPGVMQSLLTTRKSDLENIFSTGGATTDGEDPYAAGYMLLRYLANQGKWQTTSKASRNTRYHPLVIHSGDRANHAMNIFISDMHTKSLGAGKLFDSSDNLTNSSDIARYNALSGDSVKQAEWLATLKAAENKTLDDISVTTRENANIAIRVLDGALEYALDEATTIGAYLQRLEYTADNVTTSNENVQAAKSTIRDADMAKTMTDYTKNNVLLQAAQAMLAQANQNSSAVLALLG